MLKRRMFVMSLAGLLYGFLGSALYAQDTSGSHFQIEGNYLANGMNPNGSRYKGRVTISQNGAAVAFTWVVGKSTTYGKGRVEGQVVTVDFGETYPVIYVLMRDGSLHGTWADGRALERLTPR